MKLTYAQKWLVHMCPDMKCHHKEEFNQRLQWLSEGMLRNHLQGAKYATPSPVEQSLYTTYTELRAIE